MPIIPGLEICPVDEESGEGIAIPSFSQTFNVPASHRVGKCRTLHDFDKLSTIAEGSFGIIYKCRDKRTDEIFALKKFKMPDDCQGGIPRAVLREISLLKALKHVNIINSYGTVVEEDLESNYLILDYCAFSLNDLMEKEVNSIYEKDVVKCIMKQLFQGLDYIHEALVIHRDINCQNIIFTDEGILKITGFHASRFYTKGNMTPGITELKYRAPELLFQAKVYGPAVDMWSAGCVFARLLLKNPIFTGSSELEVLKSIFEALGTPSETIWPGFDVLLGAMDDGNRSITNEKPYNNLKTIFCNESLSCQELIQDLLMYYPNARISSKNCLKSTYFTDAPHACSLENLSSILKKLTPEEPMKVDN